jgi:hypothetical protein
MPMPVQHVLTEPRRDYPWYSKHDNLPHDLPYVTALRLTLTHMHAFSPVSGDIPMKVPRPPYDNRVNNYRAPHFRRGKHRRHCNEHHITVIRYVPPLLAPLPQLESAAFYAQPYPSCAIRPPLPMPPALRVRSRSKSEFGNLRRLRLARLDDDA